METGQGQNQQAWNGVWPVGSHLGSVEVPVANCNEKYYNAQKTTDIKLDDFITYWKDYSEKGHPSDMPSLYLKDWHFPKDFPEANIYQVPQYFASDWLNEYLCGKTSIDDDYRFVYMGPKDVFTSFSWSANVCGCKRWLLFPPGQENNLRDKFGRLAYDATAPELHDSAMFPNYHKLCGHFEIIQKAGEVIFVPSGWHHQVWNLEDTISINHNWVNGCNIKTMWDSLQNNLLAVKKEVEEYRAIDGWEDHCQLMLRATYGMNYEEFYNFLHFIATRRLDFLGNNNPNIMFGEWKIGINHAIFDLVQLKKVLDLLLCDSNIKFISFFQNLGNQCDNLRNDINSTFLKVTRHT
uniref:Jumonji domain-containing protein 4 n=1 Tax=Timema monikensis TaxID=170555 RepID=A0A7R9DZM2_9NEOP|nr:unnamed protein product [Timema monikensis]